MIITNAVIKSWRPVAGRRGDGVVAVGDELLARSIGCFVSPPTRRHEGTMVSVDAVVQDVVYVSRRRLDALGIRPALGDRLIVQKGRSTAEDIEYEIVAIHESAAGAMPGQIDNMQLMVSVANTSKAVLS